MKQKAILAALFVFLCLVTNALAGEFWFIRKAMWASQISIKGNATSLKKFYTFMHEKGLVDKEDLIDLKQTIKEEMPEWLATLRRFDDQSIEDAW